MPTILTGGPVRTSAARTMPLPRAAHSRRARCAARGASQPRAAARSTTARRHRSAQPALVQRDIAAQVPVDLRLTGLGPTLPAVEVQRALVGVEDPQVGVREAGAAQMVEHPRVQPGAVAAAPRAG